MVLQGFNWHLLKGTSIRLKYWRYNKQLNDPPSILMKEAMMGGHHLAFPESWCKRALFAICNGNKQVLVLQAWRYRFLHCAMIAGGVTIMPASHWMHIILWRQWQHTHDPVLFPCTSIIYRNKLMCSTLNWIKHETLHLLKHNLLVLRTMWLCR